MKIYYKRKILAEIQSAIFSARNDNSEVDRIELNGEEWDKFMAEIAGTGHKYITRTRTAIVDGVEITLGETP